MVEYLKIQNKGEYPKKVDGVSNVVTRSNFHDGQIKSVFFPTYVFKMSLRLYYSLPPKSECFRDSQRDLHMNGVNYTKRYGVNNIVYICNNEGVTGTPRSECGSGSK